MAGMAKAVADTNSGSNQGGFTTDGSSITGFSSMHDSGTGGNPSLGNFALFPYAGCAGDDVDGCQYPKKSRAIPFDNSSVKASPGYFGVTLDSGISVDMTTTQHTSLFRFKFPATDSSGNASSPLILMDLTDLSDSRQDNGTITVDTDTGRITGNARFLPSFGGGSYVGMEIPPRSCRCLESRALEIVLGAVLGARLFAGSYDSRRKPILI